MNIRISKRDALPTCSLVSNTISINIRLINARHTRLVPLSFILSLSWCLFILNVLVSSEGEADRAAGVGSKRRSRKGGTS